VDAFVDCAGYAGVVTAADGSSLRAVTEPFRVHKHCVAVLRSCAPAKSESLAAAFLDFSGCPVPQRTWPGDVIGKVGDAQKSSPASDDLLTDVVQTDTG
jgi:hypothetical protein